MLTIACITKTFRGGARALDGVTLDAPPGLFGLLGPNGSGKTTLMKILATLLRPDSGSVHLDGVDFVADPLAARRLLGYLPQDFGLYPSLTAEQMLAFLATLRGVDNARERNTVVGALLERVNLETYRRQRLGTFSGGMRQRFGIAQALLGNPLLLVVDEPTAGLDPQERFRFHNLLAEIAADVIVILSSHIVSDVTTLCDRMAIINAGSIIATGTPADAVRSIDGRVWETHVDREQLASLKDIFDVLSAQVSGGRVRARILCDGGSPGAAFLPAAPSLEDYYLSLVGPAKRT